jgi:ribosome-binding protein aMBF1 (putative translation factor)
MSLTREEKMRKLDSIATSKNQANQKWKKVADWNAKHADALDDYVTIAGRLADALSSKKWTQRELAEKLDVSPQALSRIMKGRQNLTLQTIRKIERVVGVDLISIHQNNTLNMGPLVSKAN